MPGNRANNWTGDIENNVKNIGDMAIGYKWMHNNSSKYFSKIHRYCMYVSMLLGPIASFLLLIDTTYVRTIYPDSITLSIVSMIISLFSGMLIAFVDFSNFETLSRDHQTYASKYTGIISNIRRQLGMESIYRENANDYIDLLRRYKIEYISELDALRLKQ